MPYRLGENNIESRQRDSHDDWANDSGWISDPPLFAKASIPDVLKHQDLALPIHEQMFRDTYNIHNFRNTVTDVQLATKIITGW